MITQPAMVKSELDLLTYHDSESACEALVCELVGAAEVAHAALAISDP